MAAARARLSILDRLNSLSPLLFSNWAVDIFSLSIIPANQPADWTD
jgi:hypothetical protein